MDGARRATVPRSARRVTARVVAPLILSSFPDLTQPSLFLNNTARSEQKVRHAARYFSLPLPSSREYVRRRCEDVPLRLSGRPGFARSLCARRNLHAVVAWSDLRAAGRARKEPRACPCAGTEMGAARCEDRALPPGAQRKIP